MNSLFQPNAVNRSLVLAGGGVRLAYHAGVLRALEEANISFQHIDGTSGGIFNTAMLASGLDPEEMGNRWRKLNIMHFMSPTHWRNYLRLSRMTAMGDADGIVAEVFPTLGIDVAKIKQNNRFKATFNVCNFSNKTVESIPDDAVHLDFLIAGMSLPIFMPSLKIGEDWYTDAVWMKDANMMEAVKRKAEEIWLVYCIGNTKEYLDGSFVQYVHMIEMSAAGGVMAEFDWIEQINRQILQGNSPYGQTKPIKLQVIKPKYPLPLDPDLFLGHIDTRSLINMGYAEAKAYLQHIPADGVPLDYHAAQMHEPGVSYQFMGNFHGKNKTSAFSFYPIFDIRETNEAGFQANIFASLSFQDNGKEISTFNHQLSFSKEKLGKKLILKGNYFHENKVQNFEATWLLGSIIEHRLGLDFKSMTLQLNDNEAITLYQNIGSRLKSLLKGHVYFTANTLKRWQKKNRLLAWLYN